MADDDLLEKVQSLSDLDLAGLLCLIGHEHCIVNTELAFVDRLAAELQLVASQTFGLQSTLINCTANTTLEDLASSLLVVPYHTQPKDSYFVPRPTAPVTTTTPTSVQTASPQIANVVIAKNLNVAPKVVQIQCLELLRTRRIFTRTSVQAAPKQFLFLAVLGDEVNDYDEKRKDSSRTERKDARLTPHLNDFFYISHWHDPDDGFPHLEEAEDDQKGGSDGYDSDAEDDARSFESDESVVVIRKPRSRASTPMRSPNAGPGSATGRPSPGILTPSTRRSGGPSPAGLTALTPIMAAISISPLFNEADIATLDCLSRAVNVDIDVLRFQMNVVSFLRLHRGVSRLSPAAGGSSITPQATKHFDSLVRALATLHGLDYATPALVALAARKIYRHRVRVVSDAAREERSVQWGSEVAAVEALLRGLRSEDIIEDVLGMVTAPL